MIETIILEIIRSTIFWGIVGYIAKSIFERWLSRDIEHYKSELKAVYDARINELQREAFEHQIRFARLHERRGEVIADLYKHMVETEQKFLSMTSPFEFEGEPTKREKIGIATEAFNNMSIYFEENRIYFDDELCSQISTFITSLRKAHLDFKKSQLKDYPLALDAWEKASEQVSKQVPPIKQKIEYEFRSILGIQTNKMAKS